MKKGRLQIIEEQQGGLIPKDSIKNYPILNHSCPSFLPKPLNIIFPKLDTNNIEINISPEFLNELNKLNEKTKK